MLCKLALTQACPHDVLFFFTTCNPYHFLLLIMQQQAVQPLPHAPTGWFGSLAGSDQFLVLPAIKKKKLSVESVRTPRWQINLHETTSYNNYNTPTPCDNTGRESLSGMYTTRVLFVPKGVHWLIVDCGHTTYLFTFVTLTLEFCCQR